MTFSPKCERAFNLLEDETLPSRVRACERASEYGFALLLRFVQIEASLKILRYWQKAKDGWPDRLDFLRANWAPLRDLKAADPSKYDSVIGVGGRSLREMRNRIAHEAHTVAETEYRALAGVADWALVALRNRLPARQEARKKVARVRTRSVKGQAA